MNYILTICQGIMGCLPAPIAAIIGLVIFLAILTTLLKLIKLILDAIPFF